MYVDTKSPEDIYLYISPCVGEYVSLYQQQRSVLRQRTAEKDGYIFRLSHERIDMQKKLGELQALVMQLLGERNMLHVYHSEAGVAGEAGSATHAGAHAVSSIPMTPVNHLDRPPMRQKRIPQRDQAPPPPREDGSTDVPHTDGGKRNMFFFTSGHMRRCFLFEGAFLKVKLRVGEGVRKRGSVN